MRIAVSGQAGLHNEFKANLIEPKILMSLARVAACHQGNHCPSMGLLVALIKTVKKKNKNNSNQNSKNRAGKL